jgi:hypothetical protein
MSPGSAGATAVYAGWKPSHFSAQHTLTTTADWLLWENFRSMLKLPARGQRGKALAFWHPFGEMFDPPIRSVIVEDILQPVTNDNGSETIEVKYVQFQKFRIQYSKPDAAKVEPADPMEVEIQKAMTTGDQYDALAKRLEDKPEPT